MKKYDIGFIGCGKMASAIIKGLIKSKFIDASKIIATQAEDEGIKEKSIALGIDIIKDNKTLSEISDIIFIATKPNQVLDVLTEISPYITSEKLIISIAAGITTEKLEANLPQNTKIIRVMPNTPALVNEGMSGIIGGRFANETDLNYTYELFSTIGKAIVLDNESQMDIVTAISGSGPAFYYKIINDIARAGEKLGLDYEKALLLSIQTAIGSAKMSLNREISMEELVANVATKGGCTRVGVDVMEDMNTKEILAEVIKKTTEKACALGKWFMKNLLESFLDLIFRKKCYFCRKSKYSLKMCPDCYEKLEFSNYEANRIIEGIDIYCAGVYTKELQKLIRGLKYHKQKDLAYYQAKFMYDYFSKIDVLQNKEFEIIAVPLHQNRIKHRKYNHMELVCEEFARLSNFECNFNLIKRIKDTRPQYKLNRSQRLENLTNAFEINTKFYKNKTVLILDDICTTGSTFEEMIKTLKKHNITDIVCFATSTPM